MPRSATVQSLEEIHRLVCAAVVQRRPIAAIYDGARRLLCPHVLGYTSQAIIECSVASTEVRVTAECGRAVELDGGAVLTWRNS